MGRKVVTRDTTAPTVRLVGDRTLENSAGSYVHSTASSNSAQCVQAQNRSAACDTTQTVDDKSSCETAGCIWSYEDADNYAASGNGLFDTDRIITYFEHRDDCDKDIITTVSMYSGLCPSAGATDTRTKLTCTAGTECYAGIFQYRSSNAATDPDAFEQPSSAHNLMSSNDPHMQTFPEWTAGDYSITYEAKDSAGNTPSECRDIYNVDHTFPIIQILGSDQMTLEATHQGNYIDDGATCSDQVDGVISQNVEVSGDVVNLSKVGTYTITYNCKDSANNEAPAAQRTVVVAQTSCPKCTVYGERGTGENKHNLVHEASFPYVDAGATCSDVIDGSVTVQCSTDNADYVADDTDDNDCDNPERLVNVDKTGTYTITYRAQNTVGLWNDDANCRGGSNTYQRVVEVRDTLRPVITLRYGTSGSDTDPIVAQGNHGWDPSKTQTDTQDYPSLSDASPYKTEWKAERDARMGSATDKLEFHDYPASESSSKHPETLMAEQTTSSVNGWVIGAFASAVAGLALLGYSTRRTTVATSVPV